MNLFKPVTLYELQQQLRQSDDEAAESIAALKELGRKQLSCRTPAVLRARYCVAVDLGEEASPPDVTEFRLRRPRPVACFSLGHGNLKAEQMAQAFIAARRRTEKALRRFDPPMTASVTATGHVRILMVADQLLAQPKEIK